jgi:hypothetical protein
MNEATAPRLVFDRSARLELEPYEAVVPSITPYLVKGVLPRLGVAFVVGAPRSGKTFLALDIALRVARGEPVMGRRARRAGVVYVAAEDPDGCRARIAAWKKANPRALPTPFILIGQGVDLSDAGHVCALISALGEAAERFAPQGVELGLVVFDTLSRCLPGVDENAADQMSLAFQALEAVGRACGALTLVIAHHGKDAARGIRGWSGLDAGSDATLSVVRDEASGRRTVTQTKIKNGPDGAVAGFELEPLALGCFDEDGEELWSCVVRHEAAPARPRGQARALNAPEQIVLSAVRYLTDHGLTQALPARPAGARGDLQAVRRADVGRQAERTGLRYDGDSDDAYRKRFSRAVIGLAAKTRIRVHGDHLWIV